MYRGALRSMLSELLRQERLVVAQSFGVGAPKTKELKAKLADLGLGENALIIVQAFDANLWLAARNLPRVSVLEAAEVDPVSLVGADNIVVTADALKLIEGRLQ